MYLTHRQVIRGADALTDTPEGIPKVPSAERTLLFLPVAKVRREVLHQCIGLNWA